MNGESVSSIARSLQLSRPTVRKAIKASAEPVYHRKSQPARMLGGFKAQLEQWLDVESRLPRRQRRTAQRLFEGLLAEGYRGSYPYFRNSTTILPISPPTGFVTR